MSSGTKSQPGSGATGVATPVESRPSLTTGTKPDVKFKLLMLGDGAVGKTCIVARALHGDEARLDTVSTMGVDLASKTLSVDGHHVKLQIWDTAGQERFRSLAESFFRDAHGVVMVFDLTRKSSFLNVKEWLRSVGRKVDHCDVVLVGNKADREEEREVLAAAGAAAAKELGCPYFESSAKTGTNIDPIFTTLAHLMLQRHIVGSRPAAPEAGTAAVDPKWRSAKETIDLVDLASRKPVEEAPSSCTC